MDKPKVFANQFDKIIKNNKDAYYYRGMSDEINSGMDVRCVLDNIFSSDSFVYKSVVEITLKNGNKLNEEIIAMKDNYIITLSNKKILVDDIINIKKAK